ncbi:MAG: translocation/assembly module TamB domain-containing protein [Archangium sp.]|nr:translocation/assembly module TamB domain-containing protein [Archangium sp.]MDP3572433.1 translocation/assembly module TamB domain-containing protein [Archangium sp.]
MEDPRALAAKKRRRRILLVLLVLALIPIVLLGGVSLFLESPAGKRLLREKVLALVGDSLAGKLEADQIELRGNDHIVLTHLKLFTPEGELVASLERLEADVDLPSLAGQRINLKNVSVDQPRLFLKEDDRGWNLSRAIASKPSLLPAKPSGPLKWRVQVEGLELRDGLVDLQQGDRRITATKLIARGDAQVRLEPLEVTGELDVSSVLTSPLEETLHAKMAGSTREGPLHYDVALTLGGTSAKAKLELPGLQVTVDALVAAPREVSAFLPGWPLKPVVFGKGSLSPKQAALQLSAGKARFTIDAKYDLENNSAQTLVARGDDIDLQELVGASMPSDLGFEATGALSDWRPDTLAGKVDAKATWDAKGGQRLLTANLAATAERGEAKVSSLEVTSPGVALRARGTANPKTVDAFGTLTAADLSQVGKTLRAFAGIEVGGLGGNGVLRISVNGPLRGPAAKVLGKLDRFSIAGVEADLLQINADLPDLLRPLDTDVLIHAKQLRFGDRAFNEVTFDFLTRGREIDLDLATRGMGDLRLHAIGRLDKDSNGVELLKTELNASEAKWQLEAPTRLRWVDGFTLEPFSLRDGEQVLTGSLTMTRSRLDAKARVERLDLSKLPHVVALPSLQLGGLLDADAQVTGRPSKPEVVLDARLSSGRVKGFDELDVALKGSWIDERAKGTLTAASALGQVDGTFDLPVLAFLSEKPGEGTARFTVKDLPAAELERQLGQDLPVEGKVSGTLEVSGSGARPKVRFTADASELTLVQDDRRLEVKEIQLAVFTTETFTLDATLKFLTLGSASAFALSTPLTLASVRKHVPTAEDLLSMPVKLAIYLRHLDLHQLNALRPVQDDELAGAVSVSGILTGTAKAPTGELTLSLDDLTYPPLRKASARLELKTGASHTRLTGTASVGAAQALLLTASVAALPERALGALLGEGGNADAMIESLRDTPLQLAATIKPFDFATLMTTEEGEKAPAGLISATLEANGTLESPSVRVVGALKDLRFDRVQLGSGRFELKSTGTEQRFTVALGGEGRDDFKAKGTTGLDLRLSKLRRGLDWQAAPVDVTLDSRNFDVGFLSGATELLRVVAGRVDLTGRVSGVLGLPKFVGDARVRDGRIALAGFGDYRDIGLELHAANDLIEVKKLEASSGGGKLQLVAKAARQQSGVFLLTSTGSSDRFPIVVDDQLQATATLSYQLEGDASSTLVDVRKLSLPRVDVGLPEVKRKDLQDLVRPSDIIVLRGGSKATQRRRQAAKEASTHANKPLVIRALIDAPRNIWVRSSDVNMELGLSDGFRVELNDGLRLYGEARVLRGTVEVIGREFTVQRDSQARFAGLAAQPYVNVGALHVNAREQVKITVAVAGKGTDLSIKASSEPPMPESDIYAVLATGRRNLKTSGGATLSPGQAASVVGQLAASQLKTVIAKKLPIDVFNFDTSDNFEKVKLDVGKYLSDTVYLGGSVDIGAKRERGENVWAGRLELQLTKSISLEAYAGDALSFGADAMWSRDF